jgi:hypothetical protein
MALKNIIQLNLWHKNKYFNFQKIILFHNNYLFLNYDLK